MWRWTQDNDDTVDMRAHEEGGLTTSRESFGQVVKRPMLRKEPYK